MFKSQSLVKENFLFDSAVTTSPLPTPRMLHMRYPLSPKRHLFVLKTRAAIRNIINGSSSQFLFIVGPCSIHDITAAKEYAMKLKRLAKRVSDRFLIVMRVYFEKPRTALGWKGLLYDPHLDGSNDVVAGLHLTRQLLLELVDMGIPTSAEFLGLTAPQYFGDLISCASIGSRTITSQPHRHMASGLSMPVGLKNMTNGNVDSAINAVAVIQQPHVYVGSTIDGHSALITTEGNPDAFVVLRGGHQRPNYYPSDIADTLQKLQRAQLPGRVLVDCSHDNCGKNHENQAPAFRSVIEQVSNGNRSIVGAMLESNLEAGKQAPAKDRSQLQYGVSITDPCIDWSTTEQLILEAHALMEENPLALHHG